jgi:hypothetical protein
MLNAPPLLVGSIGSRSSSSVMNLLGRGVFLMRQARFAYLRVLLVSSKSDSLALMQLMSTVKLLPPRLSCSRRVSRLSLRHHKANRRFTRKQLWGQCGDYLQQRNASTRMLVCPGLPREYLSEASHRLIVLDAKVPLWRQPLSSLLCSLFSCKLLPSAAS